MQGTVSYCLLVSLSKSMHNPVSNLMPSISIAVPPPSLFYAIKPLQNQHLISIPSTHPPLHPTIENIRLLKCHKCCAPIRNGRWSYSHQTINSRTKIRDMEDDEPFLPDREISTLSVSRSDDFTHSETQSCLPKSTLILEKNSHDIPQKP